MKLCDKHLDLLNFNFIGLETDCIYNANERMILRAHLRNLSIEDLTEDTLYPKVSFKLSNES